MIAHLAGSIDAIEKDGIVIDVNGVGYALYVPRRYVPECLKAGQRVKLYTYTHLRQDSLDLYGFLSRSERELFRLLLKVSGVGAKVALNLLSAMQPWELASAIMDGDAEKLQKVHNVGRKTAQRISIELKDKEELIEHLRGKEIPDSGSCAREVVEVLLDLGCDLKDAKKAVEMTLDKVGKECDLQKILEESLRILEKGRRKG